MRMRTSGPNRHASELSDFFESVQATLNRNRDKPPLDSMTIYQITAKTKEECRELIDEMFQQSSPDLYGVEPDIQRVEHEAADLVVCALAAWMWARGRSKPNEAGGETVDTSPRRHGWGWE